MLSSEINLYSLKPVSYFQKVIFCSLVVCIFFNKTLHMKSINTALLLLITSLLLVSCNGIEAPPAEPGVSLELAIFRKALISDIHYKLEFTIPEDEEQPMAGDLSLRFHLKNARADIPLDFRESQDHLESLVINDSHADIVFEKEHIILPSKLLQEGENRVDIKFKAGTSSMNRNPDYLYTLFVPDRARTAFPLFDQPDLKAFFELTLEIPDYFECSAHVRKTGGFYKDSLFCSI